ncbi:MAG: MGMT family protein [Candidatus Aenigmarchaeota archaeon]|nr:MGMT family protein [Candidatus Aenigmarchaeota archaeon]
MKNKVYYLLKKVPRGKITTYNELAKATGLHPRTIGIVMSKNTDPVKIPCYKVIKSDGTLGGYSAEDGIKKKIELLKKDGIIIKNNKIDLKKHLYTFSKS